MCEEIVVFDRRCRGYNVRNGFFSFNVLLLTVLLLKGICVFFGRDGGKRIGEF